MYVCGTPWGLCRSFDKTDRYIYLQNCLHPNCMMNCALLHSMGDLRAPGDLHIITSPHNFKC